MSSQSYLLGIDQGTSGSRALILDGQGRVQGYGYRPLPRLYPRSGWVEQNPDVLRQGVVEAISEALAQAGCEPAQIAACGIAGQRNTDFVWDARTGRPLANAITWQDLRTTALVEELADWELAEQRRYRLGYFPGPYSSAMHLAWRFRHQPEVIAAARQGYLRIGFSANWLLTSLGRPSGHYLDYGLVQQMGLYDFRAQQYWADWLAVLGLSCEPLPEPVPTVYPFGLLRLTSAEGAVADAPVLAVIGNEQAALLGHGCYRPGQAECTHGTASFVDVVAGPNPPEQEKLNVYYAWSLPDPVQLPLIGNPPDNIDIPMPKLRTQNSALKTQNLEHTYCLEADTTVSGAAIRWMRDEAGFFERDEELGPLAASVPDSAGVVFVPAFTGLNVPYNDRSARGAILGLTLSSSRAHIVRAFLESLGYQVRAILETIAAETGLRVEQLSLGGGISKSDQACQIQADLIGIPIVRPAFTETAARAAALLAGIGAGWWATLAELPPLPGASTTFEPRLSAEQRDAGYAQWQRAVTRARGWQQP